MAGGMAGGKIGAGMPCMAGMAGMPGMPAAPGGIGGGGSAARNCSGVGCLTTGPGALGCGAAELSDGFSARCRLAGGPGAEALTNVREATGGAGGGAERRWDARVSPLVPKGPSS